MKKGCKYAVRVKFNSGMYYDFYRRTLHGCMLVIEEFKKVAGSDISCFNLVYCGDPN